MKVMNQAGEPIELFWVDLNKNDGSLVKQTKKPLRNNTDTEINSYNSHQFKVKFLDSSKKSEAVFTKGPREETVWITFNETAGEFKIKQTTKFSEVMDTVNAATIECQDLRSEQFSSCIASAILDDVNTLADSKSEMTKYRDIIASRLRNYTCADSTLETTTPQRTYSMNVQQQKYDVNVLFDTNHAKIWHVDNFITNEECEVLMNYGRPKLMRATVAAEDGTSIVSENRKAQQASYDLFEGNYTQNPLWPLYLRVMEVTNRHAGFQLRPEGQEGLTIIQYNPEDQYTPHCDGSCDFSMHNPAGRIATAVLYCMVPEVGGATTFTKADVFVKPKAGTATFFSYKGNDGRMDDGLTQHSGCPVIKGEKWITTAWMREGVSHENPWTLYDPMGVPVLESS